MIKINYNFKLKLKSNALFNNNILSPKRNKQNIYLIFFYKLPYYIFVLKQNNYFITL